MERTDTGHKKRKRQETGGNAEGKGVHPSGPFYFPQKELD